MVNGSQLQTAKEGIDPPENRISTRAPTVDELKRLNNFPDNQPRRSVEGTVGRKNNTLLDKIDAGKMPCRK